MAREGPDFLGGALDQDAVVGAGVVVFADIMRIFVGGVEENHRFFAALQLVLGVFGSGDVQSFDWLEKFDQGDAEAMVMATAGLKRLGLKDRIACHLDPTAFLPACGQGAFAIQCRQGDEQTVQKVAPLDDAISRMAVRAERSMLAVLEGGCQVPIGGYARLHNDELTLWGMVASLDRRSFISHHATGPRDGAEDLGRQVARYLLDHGGRSILSELS